MKKYLVVIFSRQQFDTFPEVVEASNQDDAIAKAKDLRMQDHHELAEEDDNEYSAEEAFDDQEYYVVAVVEIQDDTDYSTMMDQL